MSVHITRNNYRIELDYVPPAGNSSSNGRSLVYTNRRNRVLPAGFCGGVDLTALSARTYDATLARDIAAACERGTTWQTMRQASQQYTLRITWGRGRAFRRRALLALCERARRLAVRGAARE